MILVLVVCIPDVTTSVRYLTQPSLAFAWRIFHFAKVQVKGSECVKVFIVRKVRQSVNSMQV